MLVRKSIRLVATAAVVVICRVVMVVPIIVIAAVVCRSVMVVPIVVVAAIVVVVLIAVWRRRTPTKVVVGWMLVIKYGGYALGRIIGR